MGDDEENSGLYTGHTFTTAALLLNEKVKVRIGE
jgi:hypothetical protein